MHWKTVTILPLALALCCCSQRVGDLTIVSPNNVNLKKINLDKLPQKKNVTGEDIQSIFFIFPTGQPTLEEAVSDALRKGDGDIMTDVSIYSNWWWALLYGQQVIQVKGNVVKTRGGNNE